MAHRLQSGPLADPKPSKPLPKCMAAAVVSLPFSKVWPALRKYYHLRSEARREHKKIWGSTWLNSVFRCHLFQFNNLQPTFKYITNVYKCHVYLCFSIYVKLSWYQQFTQIGLRIFSKMWKVCVSLLACCDICHAYIYLQLFAYKCDYVYRPFFASLISQTFTHIIQQI